MANDQTNASKQIDERIRELGDWRGETLGEVRGIIKEADPDVVEEWKWAKATSPGTPVWSRAGGITGKKSGELRGRSAAKRRQAGARPGETIALWTAGISRRRERCRRAPGWSPSPCP